MINFRSSLAIFGLLVVAAAARAQLVVEITHGQDDAVPIAVAPFGWQGTDAPPFDVSAVVAADLARSGRFKTLPRSDMPASPTSGSEIKFDDWRSRAVDYVVVGKLERVAADRVNVLFELYNALNHQRLLGFQIAANQAGLRLASHEVADMVYEKITGVKGAFATRIAYITVSGHVPKRIFDLIVADSDGESPHTVMRSAEPLMSPAWSPDGRSIAYVSFENRRAEIFVQILRSGERRRVSARAGVNQAPAFSPDGRKLALTLSSRAGNLDIYVLDLLTQGLMQLTRDEAIDTEPQWSRDGSSIYFTSDRAGGPQVYRVPSGGGREQRITYQGSYNARPRLSPDETQLAFVSQDGSGFHIAVMELGSNSMRMLTKGRFDESPSFAPNGETIIYASREQGRGVLATVSTDGRVEQRLAAREGEVREPAWGPFIAD